MPPVLPEDVNAPFLQPGQELTHEALKDQEESFVDVLNAIMKMAEEFQVTIRTLGSIAFRIKCPDYSYMEYDNGRYLTDIDFVALSKEIENVQDMFFHMGWTENQTVLRLFGHKRRIFYHPRLPIHSDVFIDKLRFCHEIDFRKRLEIDYPTISVTDLLLEKLQIVEINKKDLVDMMALLRQFDVASDERDCNAIDSGHMAGIFSRDWGWWKTAMTNIEKTAAFSSTYLSPEDSREVRDKLSAIRKIVDQRSKSLFWKLRSLLGERVKWYNEVEEVERE